MNVNMSIKLKDTANITAKSASSATSATKATQDSAGQQINTTYIKGLSVNGRTITYTKGDGSTGTITTQDTNTDTNTTYTLSKNGSTITLTGSDGKTTSVTDSNTTYSTGTSSTAGLTKLYTGVGTATDGTMTQAAMKTALDGKAASSHTHNYAGSSSAGGAANSATKLATARSINGTNFDGTGNITTANWGTARNIQIGNTTKSVNGSGNISWSLSEIGAASTAAATTSSNGLMTSSMVSTLNTASSRASDWNTFKASGGVIGGMISLNTLAFIDNNSVSNPNQEHYWMENAQQKLNIQYRNKNGWVSNPVYLDSSKFVVDRDLLPGWKNRSLGREGTEQVWSNIFLDGVSKNTNGYTKLPNGMILQWGIAEGRIGDFITVTLPIAFPNKILICGATVSKNMTSEFGNMHLQATWASCNRWENVNVQVIFGGNSPTKDILQGDWFAIGY